MSKMSINGKAIYYAEYKSRGLAESALSHAAESMPLHLILGDNERYWTVRPADGQRLERAGYEYAD